MASDNLKYYLRPTGLLSLDNGYSLCKRKQAISINGLYFSSIELIERNLKETKKTFFSIADFFYKAASKFPDLLDVLLKKKKNILNNSQYVAKKNHLIFGILNVTPDSFSDGGENFTLRNSLFNAKNLIDEGADFIDVGGESTRPGADEVNEADEILRVLPVIQALNNERINLSLDSRNASTMEMAILSGVKVVNDVSALKNNQKSAEIIKNYDVPLILMHMPGNPKNMMKNNNYIDVVLDVYDFLEERIKFCESVGIKRQNLIIDPGIGFGKDYKQNLDLLRNLSIFHSLGCPIMLGVSRKRFISSITKEEIPKKRLSGTLAASVLALGQGVQIHRVHDVKEINQAIKVFEKIIH